MNIIPDSDLIIYRNVDITGGQQIAWQTRAQQAAYFQRHTAFTQVKLIYVRRTGTLKVQLTTAQLADCNYMSFRNNSFEDIRFFAKITDTAYINNTTTAITYEIDEWQTFFDQVEYEGAYVLRSHMSAADESLAEADPWRDDVLELQTAEDIPQGETLYEHDPQTFPVPSISVPMAKVLVIFCSNFGAAVPDKWKQYLNEIIYSDGTAKVSSIRYDLPPRAYWIGLIGGKQGSTIISDQQVATQFQRLIDELTIQGVSSSIISVYWIPLEIWDQFWSIVSATSTTMESIRKAIVPPKSFAASGFQNPKVLRAPYQYVEVTNQDGGIMDYKYEDGDYIYPSTGGNVHGFEFVYFVQLDNRPYVAFVPYNYLTVGYNWDKRIEFANFPQAGYTTDAFLSYLATQYQQSLREQTNTISSGMGRALSKMRNSDNGIVSTLGHMGTYAGSMLNAGAAVMQIGSGDWGGALDSGAAAIQSADKATLQANTYDEARKVREGERPASSVFGPAQDGFVNHEYYPGAGGTSILAYLNRVGGGQAAPGQILCRRKKMKDVILKAIDRFFTLYGYAVRTYRLPYVCTYGQAGQPQPYFATDPITGRKITYVQTQAMRVSHAQAWVSRGIEGLFDAGTWFLDGGSLQ